MNRRVLAVMAAFVLASAGTIVLVAYVESARSRAAAGEPLTEVLVLTEAVGKGTPAEQLADKSALKAVPRRLVGDAHLTTLKEQAGKVTAAPMVAGEHVLAHRFVTAQEAEREDIPPGLLEVTVSLPAEQALGGHVSRGDTVGLVATFEDPTETKFLLHKVLVSKVQATSPAKTEKKTAAPPATTTAGGTAVPVEDTGPEDAPGGEFLITLAVDAVAVERIVFAAEQGSLWLTAEPREAGESTPGQTRESVLR